MRTPLSACCKTRSPPSLASCAEVDGCIEGIVSVFRIAGLMISICASITGDSVGLDEPGVLAGPLFRENLLKKN